MWQCRNIFVHLQPKYQNNTYYENAKPLICPRHGAVHVTVGATLKTKNIDNGGTGMFKAIAVKESGMPDFVIYRPKDLMHAHARCGALPLLMFANGGCMDTSIGYERMLTEIASHGYIVMAIGEMQDVRNDRKESHTPRRS